jgi:uncharacterized protein
MKKISKLIIMLAVTVFILGCSDNKGSLSNEEASVAPLKILYVTSAGWFHDYEKQVNIISRAINKSVNADIDVIVGDVNRIKSSGFSEGYDLLFYNFCHAAQRDEDLVESLISPVRDQGIPAIAMHCAMHSFQYTSSWPEFLGLHTLRHEQQRGFLVEKSMPHAVTEELPSSWAIASDELYITLSKNNEIIPLLTAYGIETKSDHHQAWLFSVGEGQLMGTTLGHSEESLNDDNFQSLLGRSVAFLTGRSGSDSSVKPFQTNILSENVRYPNRDEKRCVVHNMFSIGGKAVESCVESLCHDKQEVDLKSCTQQCQQDNPWPVPETLWDDCRNGVLTSSQP